MSGEAKEAVDIAKGACKMAVDVAKKIGEIVKTATEGQDILNIKKNENGQGM
jgi:hypothetical protein